MKKQKLATNSQSSSFAGAEVLDDMAAYIRRHLVCDDHQLTLLTLWSACTHCYNHFQTAPYFHVRSPQPHCGKSLCLKLLADLSDADLVYTGLPAAPLFERLLLECRLEEGSREPLRRFPVVIDDFQRSFGPSERQPLVCLLASGLESCSFFAWGENEYCFFSPKAFAGNSPLPPSLAAQCIPIVLRRPKPWEEFVRYGLRDSTRSIGDRLQQWLQEASPALDQAAEDRPPDLPAALSLGQSQCAESLVHIADVAGGPWPARVRAALVAVFNLAETNPELQMLSDLRTIFSDNNDPEYLTTEDLLSQLRTLDSRPWSAWTSKSGRRLAGLLHPFGIMSRRLYIDSNDGVMGYLLKDLHDPWERYLPSVGLGPERLQLSSETNATQPAAALSALGAD